MNDRSHPEVYIKRMRYFLNLIGNPHKKNFNFIHIAGTSGKGSVVSMIHETLNKLNKKVGSFSSPFTITSIEKIKVNDKYILPKEVVKIVDYLKPFINEAYIKSPYGGPSYFEVWLAIALLYFEKKKCEYVVLEVGCGGRYDAGNVIEKPVVTAVTNIDLDHTQLLGNTLEKIAYEKAGIMKKGSPFFTTEKRPRLLKLFEKWGKQSGAKVILIESGEDYKESNKALAKAILEYLKFPIGRIRDAILPCRFEIVQKFPIVILDGAHSVAKMKSTVSNLKNLKFGKLILVLGISGNKDIDGICKVVVPYVDYLIATRFNTTFRKGAGLKELMFNCKKYIKKNIKVDSYIDSEHALDRALKKAGKYDLVLVTGSFFLSGELRKRWYSEERILKNLKSF